jgi:hypothetical protein
MLRVRLFGDHASVVAWVASSAAGAPQPESLKVGSYGTIGLGRYGSSSSISCPRPLAVYVRSVTRGEVHVGHLKADQSARVLSRKGGDVVIDLGNSSGTLATYVRASDVAACAP